MACYLRGDFRGAHNGFEQARREGMTSPSVELLAGISAVQEGRVPDAIPHLERVLESDAPLPDELMGRYAPPDRVRLSMQIAIVEGVYATVALDSYGAALILAELYQGAGKRDSAIALMRQLLELDPNDEALRLSLCDLLFEAADFHGVAEVGADASPLSTWASRAGCSSPRRSPGSVSGRGRESRWKRRLARRRRTTRRSCRPLATISPTPTPRWDSRQSESTHSTGH